MIDLKIYEEALAKNIQKARENNIIIPTFKQMQDPDKYVPEEIKAKLKNVGLWELNPLNLFRITWKNEPKETGGLFGQPNFIELPSKLTGVKARIFCMIGKWFPTGCHKVGASFGCLVPRLVTGQMDCTYHKAVWPSTGNYCRGGAFNSKLLACQSVAILPEGMSRERFDWLREVADEIIATAGTESNVKEIFDKVNEIKATRKDNLIFNQFEEMGNYLWHYNVTAGAIADAFESLSGPKRFAGVCLTSGSGGSLASGDALKQKYPGSRIAVGETLQCPTILNNGFGDHRVEGIGDKHIPWVHNVKNTDMAIAVDDNYSMAFLRLFNEDAGREYLINECGMSKEDVDNLAYMGISGITNMIMAIKFAKYYELNEKDCIFTVLTDSIDMYQSRLEEMREEEGEYKPLQSAIDMALLQRLSTDHMLELGYQDRKRVHNLKYYTWIEQQGRQVEELDAQWYDEDNTWLAVQNQADELDELIKDFNKKTGLLG